MTTFSVMHYSILNGYYRLLGTASVATIINFIPQAFTTEVLIVVLSNSTRVESH